jgi:hypothetical protein
MKKFYVLGILFLLSVNSWGQNGIIGDGFGAGDWTTTDNFVAGVNASRLFITQSNIDNGNAYFRLVRNWSSDYTNFGPSGCVDTDWTNPGVRYVMSVCGSGAFYINTPNTTDNYVFKTPNGDTAMEFVYFRVQGDIRNITSVSSSVIAPYLPVTITATLDGSFNPGQGAYLRYTSDGWSTSYIVPMTGSGTSYSAEIPYSVNTPNSTIQYYAFTSGDGLTIDPSDADLFTINYNNNGGSSYQYTVTSNIDWCNLQLPTNTPHALVMGEDYTMYSQVYIDGLTNSTTTVDSNVTCWFGYNSTNTDPATWTNWVLASSSADLGNNYEYSLSTRDLLPSTNGTYYIATRYQYNSEPYVYGGYNTDNGSGGYGGFWGAYYNGMISESGVFDVEPISIIGDAVGTPPNDIIDMYSIDGENFSVTVNLTTNWLKFIRDHDWGNNDWGFSGGLDTFYLGTATLEGSTNFTVPVTGTYLANFNITTGVYSFTYVDCTVSHTTTWTSGAWNNGPPTILSKAIIDDTYSTSTDGEFITCECEVNSSNTLTVDNDTYLSVAGKITNNGSIVIESQGNLVQYADAITNDGAGTYQVNKSASGAMDYDYIYWSSPVSDADLTSVFASNPQDYIWEFVTGNFLDIYSGTSYPQTTGTTGDGYDDNGDDWRNMNDSSFNGDGSTLMNPTQGYIVLVEGSEIPLDFTNMEMNPGQNVEFTGGVFNNGTYNFTSSQDGTTDQDEYNPNLNFTGNPYPSAISAERFLLANPHVETLYFWTHQTAVAPNPGPNAYDFDNSDYASYTLTGGVASSNGGVIPTGNIASCQGFMASITEGSTDDIVYTNLMRLSVNNDNFYRLDGEGQDKIWLNLTNDVDLFRQVLVAFLPSTTEGVDNQYDGLRLYDNTITDFYTLINNNHYSINAMPTFENSQIIPLGIQIQTSGTFAIDIDHTSGIFIDGQAIYLEDTYENIIHDFATGTYTFYSETGSFNDRFILRFTDDALSITNNELSNLQLYPNPSNGLFYIKNAGQENIEISVYDITGKLVMQKNVAQSVDIRNFTPGVYVAQLKTEQGTTVRKLIVE